MDEIDCLSTTELKVTMAADVFGLFMSFREADCRTYN